MKEDVYAIEDARHYFEYAVLGSRRALENHDNSLRLAMEASVHCLSLTDWIVEEFGSVIPEPLRRRGAYVRHLKNSNEDFALVADVANAAKHRRLTLGVRRIDRAHQIRVEGLECGDACDLPLAFVVVRTSAAVRVRFLEALDRAIEFLDLELRSLERASKT